MTVLTGGFCLAGSCASARDVGASAAQTITDGMIDILVMLVMNAALSQLEVRIEYPDDARPAGCRELHLAPFGWLPGAWSTRGDMMAGRPAVNRHQPADDDAGRERQRDRGRDRERLRPQCNDVTLARRRDHGAAHPLRVIGRQARLVRHWI